MTHDTHGFCVVQDRRPPVPPTPTMLDGLNLEAETGGRGSGTTTSSFWPTRGKWGGPAWKRAGVFGRLAPRPPLGRRRQRIRRRRNPDY